MKTNWRAGCWETSTSGSVGGGWKSTGCLTNTRQLAGRLPDGLHLTETLLRYPGPAFILDPKGEQYERTAAWRRQWGPIYRVPGHQVHLAGYYRNLRDRDDAYELHYHLLRPWQGRESIFAEKSLSLFHAVGAFAQAHKRNAIRLLLDLAESNPQEALAALRSVPEARRHVDIFTNGASPQEYHHDRFVTSALGNFTARLAPYQAHIDTIAPPDLKQRDKIIPPEWAEQNGTVYLTYSLNDLRAAGGGVGHDCGGDCGCGSALPDAPGEQPATGLAQAAGGHRRTAGGGAA